MLVHVLCMWSVFVHVRLSASAPHEHVPSTFFVQHVNNADHGPSTCMGNKASSFTMHFICESLEPNQRSTVCSARITDRAKKSLQERRSSMPKHLIPAGWLENPCQFLCHESTASTCGFCEEEFSFWNGARHCQFCGHLFHRRHCTSKIQVDGVFFRRRICPRCEYYRNIAAEKLKRGTLCNCTCIKFTEIHECVFVLQNTVRTCIDT